MKFGKVRVLRHAAMLLMLGSTLAAGIVPDWSRVLKAQGYYGAVDLGLSLTPGSQPIAGSDTYYFLQAVNHGPDDARRARTIAGFSGAITFGATSGCVSDPLGFPQCVFATPLNSGGTADYLLHATIAPDARGDVRLAVAVTSDDEEINPGDEVSIYDAHIIANLDIQTTASCDSVRVRSGRPLVCHLKFQNHGPAAALRPTLWSYINLYPVQWTCQASRPELCPSAQTGNFVYSGRPEKFMPGEQITFTATGTYVAENGPLDSVQSSAYFTVDGGEFETNPINNNGLIDVPVSLFFDGFDGN